MDVMSCEGFLLTNYQSDFFLDTITDDGSAAFIPGTDYDFYSSTDELMEKVGYYLSHENDRAEIAHNGFEKVKKYYSLDHFLHRVLDEFL
jgi:spore maturation protein CgeB